MRGTSWLSLVVFFVIIFLQLYHTCQVWKAKDPDTDDVVALKMIKATDKEGNSCDVRNIL